MTGSGKTGLAVGLIEEALQARIPVIVVDPKGDMGNLALAFPGLSAGEFAPWVDADQARREGKTPEQAAEAAAALWAKGLEEWGIGREQVASYAAGRDVRILTPGSTAGIPLSLIDSLDPPEGGYDEADEEARDEIDALVTALLGFVGIEADPVGSREYILLFHLIEHAWRAGHGLTLEALVASVANPPIDRIGALTMDAFFPERERAKLMMALNNLVASPPFQVWRKGEPVDIESWVRSPDGRTRLTIVYTAHLEDEQRVLVTALILNRLKSWMRRQPGTSELRALFYMDEIFGYFPPTANPPTKKPLLTLLKQARAYGLGVLLSTQNPVDLDYKGLANMGFWAIGRLQTEQDQERIREGIEAALPGEGPGAFAELMAGVQKRVFLVHDIHRRRPELVHSRWAMSYLRGPLTRDEIRRLMPRTESVESAVPTAREPAPQRAPSPAPTPPLAPRGLDVAYLNLHGGDRAEPYLFVRASARYKAGSAATDEETFELAFPMPPRSTPNEVLAAEPIDLRGRILRDTPVAGLQFAEPPSFVVEDGGRAIERVLKDRLDDRLALDLWYDAETKSLSRPGESKYDFAARLEPLARRSAKVDALERKIAAKRDQLARAAEEVRGRRLEKWTSIGTSILGSLGSKRRRTPNLGGVLAKNRMETTAEGRRQRLEQEIRDLEAELRDLLQVDPSRFEERRIKPTATDVAILRHGIVWVY